MLLQNNPCKCLFINVYIKYTDILKHYSVFSLSPIRTANFFKSTGVLSNTSFHLCAYLPNLYSYSPVMRLGGIYKHSKCLT